ncbi:MAG: hypothetical protein AB8F74_06975, partial [Saprospiraceae bacterium]
WSLGKTILSAISFVLISIVLFTIGLRVKRIVFSLELIFWGLKLILHKGGYAVGFGGGPDPIVFSYDLIAILTRLFLFIHLFEVHKVNALKVTAVGLVVLGLKAFMFAAPVSLNYQEKWNKESANATRKEMVGSWVGSMRSDHNKIDSEVIINSTTFTIIRPDTFSGDYFLELDNAVSGQISRKSPTTSMWIYIDKIEKDSLVFDLSDLLFQYDFELKRKN